MTKSRMPALGVVAVLAMSACGGGAMTRVDAEVSSTTATTLAASEASTTRASTTTSTTAAALETVEQAETTTTLDEPGERVPEEKEPAITGEVPGDLLRPVLADAEERLSTSDFDVTRAEFVEWPDGSLGCPEPGMVYPQVITPGYRVEIESGDRTLDYRLDERGFFKLCDSPPITAPSGDS